MDRRKPFVILLLVLLLAAMMLLPAIADAGNFSGGSDYGGGGSSWSGGDSDYSGGDGGSFLDFIVVSPIIIVVLIIFSLVSKKTQGAAGTQVSPSQQSLSPISSLIAEDPNFSERDMKERIANLYVRMQGAWEAKKFEEMQPFMKDALYAQFALQLNELIRAGQTNRVEKIAVLSVGLIGWRRDEAAETVVATVSTRIIDYTIDDRTGKVVSGSKTAEKFMTYQWELSRSAGTKTLSPTDAPGEKEARRCPSCGAPLNLNQSAKCPYCDSVINAKDFDWVISAVRGISQRTGS